MALWDKDRIASNLIRSGARWNDSLGQAATVSYSFPTTSPYGTAGEGSGFSTFNADQKAAAVSALVMWADVANISFVESSTNNGNDGQIRFSNTTTGPAVAWAYYPSASSTGGDVWINPNYSHNTNLAAGGYGLLSMIHEIGHALGLSHPGNYNGTARLSQRRYSQDSRKHTIMSYFDHPNDYAAYASSPLRDDIYALQKAYGVNWTTRSGNSTYQWNDDAYFVQSIWDGGGNDTIDASNQTQRVVLNLGEGSYSSIGKKHYSSSRAVDNLSVAYGAVIENAKGGAGDDTITGNDYANTLEGNGGNDIFDGKGGADTMMGGAGSDKYILGRQAGIDTIIDSAGTNTVRFSKYKDSEINFEKDGSDLILVSKHGDQLKLKDYYNNSSAFSLVAQQKLRRRRGGRWVSFWGDGALNVQTTDDVRSSFGTGASVAIGGSVSSSVDYAYDKDLFKVTLQAGKRYQFDLLGKPTGDGTLGNAYLGLYDAVGNRVRYDDNSGSSYNSRIAFTADLSGTYYLQAGGNGSKTGSYSLKAKEIVLADHASASATNLSFGASSSDSISNAYDTDWFKVSLVAGKKYVFDLKGRSSGSGTLYDPKLYLYSGDLAALASNDNSGAGRDARITFRASITGDYFLKTDGVGRYSGSYQLSAAETEGEQVLAVGGSAFGSISKTYEKDWFKVDLVAGTAYQFDMKGSPSGYGTLKDSLFYLYSGTKSLISDNNSGTGKDSRFTYEVSESGTYYLKVQGTSRNRGSYKVSAVALGADDHASDSTTTSSLAVGGVASGAINHTNDNDWFKVSLTAGETYQFEMTGNASAIHQGSILSNSKLSLYGTDGSSLLGSNNDFGGSKDSRLTFTAASTGTYFVAAQQGAASSLGQYRISLSKTHV